MTSGTANVAADSAAIRNVAVLSLSQALRASQSSLLISVMALAALRLTEPALSTLPISLLFAATLLSTVPVAWGMRRLGAKTCFLVAALLGSAGAAACALGVLSSSFGLLCFGAALVGVHQSAGNFYRFVATDAAPLEYKSRALSWVMAGGVTAAFVGPNLGRWTQYVEPWPEFFVSFVCVALLGLLAVASLTVLELPRASEEQRPAPRRRLREIATQPKYLVAALGATLGFSIMSLLMTATPLAMKEHHHPFSATASVIQWHVFAMFAPSFFTGHVIARLGAPRVMLLGVAFDASCVVLNVTGESFFNYWGGLFALGLGWNFLYLGATALLTETYRPEEREGAQAVNDFVVNAGVVLASLLSGAMHHSLGWRAMNWVVVPGLIAVVASLLWLRRAAPRAAPQGAA